MIMEENNKRGITRPEENQYKGSTLSLKSKILSTLRGEKCTAIQLNRRFGFNDARKVISILRQEGYPIKDYLLNDNRKVYYLQKSGEKDLFTTEGGAYDTL